MKQVYLRNSVKRKKPAQMSKYEQLAYSHKLYVPNVENRPTHKKKHKTQHVYSEQQLEPFKKRWFCLDTQERKQLYYIGRLVRTDPKKPTYTPCSTPSFSSIPVVLSILIWWQNSEEQGNIFIGIARNGYTAKEITPKSPCGYKWKCSILPETPQRVFLFMCERERKQKQWLEAFRQV